MKVLAGGIFQEANTFSGIKVEYSDFRKYRNDGLLHYLPQCQVLEDAGFSVIPAVFATIIPSAPLNESEFSLFIDDFFNAYDTDIQPDAIYLCLHGAMYIKDVGSGEQYFISKLRDKYGWDMPIFASFDFHGNMFPELANLLNYATAYKTAPHRDEEETGIRAVKALIDCMNNKIHTKVRCLQFPMTFPGEMVITDDFPSCEILKSLQLVVDDGLALETSWLCGFIWSDAKEIYMSVAVTATDFTNVLQSRIQRIAEKIWDLRHDFHFSTPALETHEAVETALQASMTMKKVFLSDSGDNVTAGTSGDSAYMAQMLFEACQSNEAFKSRKVLVTGIADAQAVRECALHQPGDEFELAFGGKLDSTNHRVSARVRLIRHGQMVSERSNEPISYAIVLYGNIEILLNAKRFAYTDIRHFTAVGIDLEAYDLICIKLGYLYPELEAIKGMAFMAFSPGNAPLNAKDIPYTINCKPFYPRCEVAFTPEVAW